MNKQEASQILRAYVPDKDLEVIPEVRKALAFAERDPDLQAVIGSDRAFDASMTKVLRTAPVPKDLEAALIEWVSSQTNAGAVKQPVFPAAWFHFLTLGAAAVVTVSLALFFTYVYEHPPVKPSPINTLSVAAPDPIIEAADALFAALQPRMRGQTPEVMRQFLISNGGHLPKILPPGFSWEASRACDVVEVDGARVSIICFESPDKSGMLHLFTFRRSDFPEARTPRQPVLRERSDSCCAAWSDEDGIHVLYSDKGRKNLHQALEI